jgi:hypothetical protein
MIIRGAHAPRVLQLAPRQLPGAQKEFRRGAESPSRTDTMVETSMLPRI